MAPSEATAQKYHIKGNKTKVSYMPKKGLFRKFVGGKMFYLGSDRRTAQVLAATIVCMWQARKPGSGQWHDPEDSEFIAMVREALYSGTEKLVFRWNDTTFEFRNTFTSSQRQPGRSSSATGPTVLKVLDEYKSHIAVSPVSDSHRVSVQRRIEAIKQVLPVDRPLASIGYDDLVALVGHYASRPVSKKTGKPISVATAVNMIGTARMFFAWARDSDRWVEPRGFDRAFRLNRKAMANNEERKQAARGVKTFTLDEIGKLWAAANEQGRLYLLLGLNCGFAQTEISSLRTWEVQFDEDPPRIERHRRKTEVFGQWILWERTRKLLERRMRRTPANKQDHAILTRSGNPLVRHSKNSRTDTIALAWTRLVKKAGVTPLSFKYLRKTGADLIRKIGGRDVSEAYLAHSEKTLAQVYTNRDFARVADALRILEQQVEAVLD